MDAWGSAVTVMIGLNIIIASVLAFTAAMCVVASVALRGKWSLAWLAVALTCGSIQTLLMTFNAGTNGESLAAALLAPVAYLCAGRGIRAMDPRPAPLNPLVEYLVLGLAAFAVAMTLAGAPFIVFALSVQAACTIASGRAAYWMIRQARPQPLDIIVSVGLVAIAGFCAIRIPLLLFVFGPDVTLAAFRHSGLETVLLSVSGLLVPPVIFLLLARTIGDTLTDFQLRSERDSLTGLLNRRAFDAAATTLLADGGAVIFCDIDNFKQVNDRYGHQTGDDVICAFAGLIERTGLRVGRMGGEEFAVLAPGKSAIEALDIADMLRARFNDIIHPGLAPGHMLSASFGVAEHVPGEPLRGVFQRADAALYQAKAAGRNRALIFVDEPGKSLRPAVRPMRRGHAA